MQRTAAAPKATVHQQIIRSSVMCKALPDRQQQVANVAAFAATVSVLSSIAFAPVALADLNVYEAAAGGGLGYASGAAISGTLLVHVGHTSHQQAIVTCGSSSGASATFDSRIVLFVLMVLPY
jgi:hypothetical protein